MNNDMRQCLLTRRTKWLHVTHEYFITGKFVFIWKQAYGSGLIEKNLRDYILGYTPPQKKKNPSDKCVDVWWSLSVRTLNLRTGNSNGVPILLGGGAPTILTDSRRRRRRTPQRRVLGFWSVQKVLSRDINALVLTPNRSRFYSNSSCRFAGTLGSLFSF